MHIHPMEQWRHSHIFLGDRHEHNEKKTWLVIGLTTMMMIAEITCGTLFGSMALVADGWHMSTHAGALSISAFAYMYARRHKHDTRFAFGTGKLGDLAGFTSAIILAMIALFIMYQAIQRMISPIPIAFGEAIAVASLGLSINIVSALLLRDDHHHSHSELAHKDHHHDHHHHDEEDHDGHAHHHDNNLRSAYIHVMADAATSVLAIMGLLAGWIYGWIWMDAVMGMIGALVIISWAYNLIRDTGRILLDVTPDEGLIKKIRERLEKNGDTIADLHLWQVGPGHFGTIVSLVADEPSSPSAYKAKLADLENLSHVTVEVNECQAPRS